MKPLRLSALSEGILSSWIRRGDAGRQAGRHSRLVICCERPNIYKFSSARDTNSSNSSLKSGPIKSRPMHSGQPGQATRFGLAS